MPNQEKINQIVGAFQKMDITLLETLLDNNKTYQDATKEVFLRKVNKVFTEFKASGDTHLQAHSGVCNSNIDRCPNKGCTGYSFVGNHSKKHSGFIFKDLKGITKDIHYCSGFHINDETVEIGNSIRIEIKQDEKADFNPSEYFLIEIQKYKSAYKELMQHQKEIINKELYGAWFEKYSDLYESRSLPYSYTYSDKFFWLYSDIEELMEFLETTDEAKQAVEEFQNIDENNELQLLEWLVKYEEAGKALTLFLFEEVDYEYPERTAFFKQRNLKISTKDFEYLFKFYHLFDKYYHDMLEKHRVEEEHPDDFQERFFRTKKEEHLLYYKQKYQEYLDEYKKYSRNTPMIESEEAFIEYIKNMNDTNDFFLYLKEFFEEESTEYWEQENKIAENYLFLSHHLKRRGLYF